MPDTLRPGPPDSSQAPACVAGKVDDVRDVRVVLIGGTSNVGKSTVAHAVAETLRFECLSISAERPKGARTNAVPFLAASVLAT